VQVWRHTCTVLDFVAGRTAVFENGEKYFDKTDIKVKRLDIGADIHTRPRTSRKRTR
jgi:hypothetical protein